jgi:hypothetical protein
MDTTHRTHHAANLPLTPVTTLIGPAPTARSPVGRASVGALPPRPAPWIPRWAAVVAVCLAAWLPGLAPAAELEEAQWRSDLEQFEREFLERDRAYAPDARERAKARLATLRERRGSLERTALLLELAQLAALADNGHTLLSLAQLSDTSNRVGIRLVPFGSDFRVVRAMTPDDDLLGLRLVAIDDQPLQRLREAAHRLQGGTPTWRDRSAPLLFESPEQLQLLGLARDRAAADYRFARDDGSLVSRRLVAGPPAADRPRARTERLLLPEVGPPAPAGMPGWRSALALDDAPWALRDAMQRLRWRWDAAQQLLVVEMRAVASAPGHSLPAFFDAVRAAVAQHSPRHLVLDLRQNGGGDLTQARDFAESLPTLVPGRLFVLTSAWTFSAAISTAGYLKQAAPQRVTLVGEAPGDRLQFFAEGRPLRLQHSQAALLPATERHDYQGGCQAFSDCHGPVVRRPIRVDTLAPELPAPWTWDSWRRGIDPAMDAVAAALARG